MDVPSLKEIQEDLEKLESMERDYHLSLEEKREYEIRFANRGNARWAEMEERCTKKRMEVGQFEQGFRQNISFYTSARCEVVKICTLKEMELIEKLKNRYGFTGSVLVDKYTFYSEKVAIITRAVNQNIAWDEEKDGPSSGYDHWTTSKLRDMDD